VSAVGRGMGVLDRGPRAPRGRVISWGFSPHWFHRVSVAYLLNRNVFDSHDTTSLESTFHWFSDGTVKLEVNVEVCEKFAKM